MNAVEEEAEENCSVASGVLEYGTYIGAGTYVMAGMAQAQDSMANSQANSNFSLKIPNVLDHINYWLRLVLQRAGELATCLMPRQE